MLSVSDHFDEAYGTRVHSFDHW